MPPKRVAIQPARRQAEPKGYVASVYDALTSEDNVTVVISVAMFGAAVTFLSSSWSELLLPEF